MPIEIKQGKVAKVTAEVNILQKQKDEHPDSAIIASGVRYRPGAYDASVTGKITSHYDDNVKDAYVSPQSASTARDGSLAVAKTTSQCAAAVRVRSMSGCPARTSSPASSTQR